MNAVEPQRERTDGAHAGGGEPNGSLRAASGYVLESVNHDGRRVAVHHPAPSAGRQLVERTRDSAEVELSPPMDSMHSMRRAGAPRVIDEAVAEFPVGQHEAGRAEQRELCGDDI